MKKSLAISAVGHGLVLGWGLVTFAAKPLTPEPVESMPVDLVTISDFTKMTSGTKDAPKAEAQKPLVEKVADKKPPPEDLTAKITEKHEIKMASAAPPPEPKPEPKVEPKKVEAKKPEAPKPDPIAEALKKDEAKKPEPKKEEPKKDDAKQAQVPVPPKRPPRPQPPQPRFDADKVAALLDKRAPQRHAYTGEVQNTRASLGTPTGNAPTMTATELDALRSRLRDCWNVPIGVAEAQDLSVVVSISFRPDGSLSADPVVINRGSHPAFQIAAESALRAVRKCAPYTFLPKAKYEAWKNVEVNFDPRDMFRG